MSSEERPRGRNGEDRVPLGERVLLMLSRSPNFGHLEDSAAPEVRSSALEWLLDVFPDLLDRVRDRDVLDFGCGEGEQVVALALNGARFVVGVDSNARLLDRARALAVRAGVTEKVAFVERLDRQRQLAFDVVISQNSMEHFPDPGRVLAEIREALRLGGTLLMTFSPPWYAPHGSHMHFFTKVPWVHLLFSERTVMNVRRRFRTDGALRYEDVEGGLNRMSLAKFERLISVTGWRPRSVRYDPVKRLPLVSRVPLLRELLVNRVSAVLEKSG